jgi:3-hydroxymyristoyl/3-hydroxydecanoyl-(acyl carrier protein) dehydratase
MPARSAELEALFDGACRAPLVREPDRALGPWLDRRTVEGLLPHRDPFLLIDRITRVDLERRLIVSRCGLSPSAPVFAGHFPGRARWPGVLQVEAVGQAGACLVRLLDGHAAEPALALTDIVAARFMRPIEPGADVEILVRALPDGLFTVLVGQCVRGDEVCSAAAVRGIAMEVTG